MCVQYLCMCVCFVYAVRACLHAYVCCRYTHACVRCVLYTWILKPYTCLLCCRLKPDSHSKGESKSHSRSLDVHSKSSDVHSKPVDSHSKSLNSHSKPLDSHSDRKHGYQSGTPNKYHRDHRRGSSSDHRSGTNAHRSSSHEKRAAEHGTPKESYHHHHQHKASRTPQKLSTGSKDSLYTHTIVMIICFFYVHRQRAILFSDPAGKEHSM